MREGLAGFFGRRYGATVLTANSTPSRPTAATKRKRRKRAGSKLQVARDLWALAAPATGTPGHDYLAERLVWPPPAPDFPALPPSVRWLAFDNDLARDAAARAWPKSPPPSWPAGLILFGFKRAGEPEVCAVSAEAVADGAAVGWNRSIGRRAGALFVASRNLEAEEIRLSGSAPGALAASLLRRNAITICANGAAAMIDAAARLSASRLPLVLDAGGKAARKVRDVLQDVQTGHPDPALELAERVRAKLPDTDHYTPDDLAGTWRQFFATGAV